MSAATLQIRLDPPGREAVRRSPQLFPEGCPAAQEHAAFRLLSSSDCRGQTVSCRNYNTLERRANPWSPPPCRPAKSVRTHRWVHALIDTSVGRAESPSRFTESARPASLAPGVTGAMMDLSDNSGTVRAESMVTGATRVGCREGATRSGAKGVYVATE